MNAIPDIDCSEVTQLAKCDSQSVVTPRAKRDIRLRCTVCGERFVAKRKSALTCSDVCRQRRSRQLRAATPELPLGPFDLIYADPPWDFETRSAKGKGRSPDYDKMDIAAICRLQVSEIAAPNAALVMWFTDEHAHNAMRVIESWGFEFKRTAELVWVKMTNDGSRPRMMLGYSTRKCTEQALLATRGKGLTRINKGVRNVIHAPYTEPSVKPDEAYDRLERCWGDVRRVELFARRPRAGWTSWGNQLGEAVR
jgi:N6-adenosine-specific RNA methylase IME4